MGVLSTHVKAQTRFRFGNLSLSLHTKFFTEKNCNHSSTSQIQSVIDSCKENFKTAKAICLSIDGFSDIQSRSVFHVLMRFPVQLHISSIIFGREHKYAIIPNHEIHGVEIESCLTFSLDSNLMYGMVTWLAKLCDKNSSSMYCRGLFNMFSYGYACHASSLVVKYMIKKRHLKDLLKKAIKIAYFLKNTHISNHVFEIY